MTTSPDIIVRRLGYLGLLPFALCMVAIGIEKELFGLSAVNVFITYSAVILSFLSGALWGNAIDHIQHALSRNALILSNLLAFIAWGVMLQSTDSNMVSLLVLLFGFITVWLTEMKIRESEHEEKPAIYRPLRKRLTMIVVSMHLLVALYLILV
ncbi:DUF3429 domain-containing protein [Vibrio sp. Of7-15]|uniref:DUF3429 domain-containing protein n=1 Tax=Vibrio sp. Of7-15 TaxID=2724879 RepID=UPI001EF30CE0|nr:DUF3429 domain-containing protein [Vibrio sp. Of7-15]MCG7499672.1 DUF3429 domain-containing protein [Vibrio sp. Of7-15]